MKKSLGFLTGLYIVGAVVLLVACRGETEDQEERSRQRSAGDHAGAKPHSAVPDPLVFEKFTEKKEGAWTMLIPKGWLTEGGIFHLDPSAAGGYANAVGPKVDFKVKRDPKGTVMIQWLPDMYYCDVSKSPAGQMGLFPPGSNYNGMEVQPCPGAKDFLMNMAFPRARKQVRKLQALETKPMPSVLKAYQKASPIPDIQYDAALVTVSYLEAGIRYKEQLFTVIEDLGQLAGGMWQNKQTVFARAPADEAKEWRGVGDIVFGSVRLNTHWLAAVARATAQRTQTGLSTQSHVQQLDEEMAALHRRVNDEIRHDAFLSLTGQEDYVNPYTGETEIRPDGWHHHWQNESGEIVVSNNPDYDPNQDDLLNRSDFKRSKIRKR